MSKRPYVVETTTRDRGKVLRQAINQCAMLFHMLVVGY
jgi:hypothetical protein